MSGPGFDYADNARVTRTTAQVHLGSQCRVGIVLSVLVVGLSAAKVAVCPARVSEISLGSCLSPLTYGSFIGETAGSSYCSLGCVSSLCCGVLVAAEYGE